MRQNRLFVPMRIFIAVIAVLFGAVISPKAATDFILASGVIEEPKLDQIITGETIAADQLEEWKAKKAIYDSCGLCGKAQPYPGDLPK